jgi:hypothetical protein
MTNRLRIALVALTALATAACIERPASPREKRDGYDRSGMGDVILNSAPGMARRVGAVYGESVELLGVDVSPSPAHAGDSVQVSFYYRANEEPDEDWKIFVHIDDHGGHGDRINGDHWPANERYRTNLWRRGEVIKDTWSFRLPSYYQGEGYDLWTGFYQPGKDDRWPLSNKSAVQNDGQTRVLAGFVPVARQ